MKPTQRILTVLLLCSITNVLFAAQEISTPVAHTVYGFVGENAYLSVDLDSTVFPFNLEDPAVVQNTNPNIVRGIRIGSIFFSSNNDKFSVAISHDLLTLKDDPIINDPGTKETIDYRLDVFVVPNSVTPPTGKKRFLSIVNNQTVSFDKNNFSTTDYSISDLSLYVSLNDTDVSSLKQGLYESTITFVMTIT